MFTNKMIEEPEISPVINSLFFFYLSPKRGEPQMSFSRLYPIDDSKLPNSTYHMQLTETPVSMHYDSVFLK